jgi:cobalt-zinc-cadmium resistance protein CzcA
LANPDIALKLFGDNFDVLIRKSRELADVFNSIAGCADLNVDQIAGQPVLQIRIKQDQIARYGVPAETVLNLVEAVSGKPLGEVMERRLRFPLVLRLPDDLRDGPRAIASLTVEAASGERIPLDRLATVVIGGVISSTLMTLFVLPVLYHLAATLRPKASRTSEPLELFSAGVS